MAFINNDEIEEIGSELPKQAFTGGIFCDCLIDREVDVSCLADFALSNFESRISERGKIFRHRIIDQYASIGKVENFRLTEITSPVPSSAPQLPADLKCNLSLAS